MKMKVRSPLATLVARSRLGWCLSVPPIFPDPRPSIFLHTHTLLVLLYVWAVKRQERSRLVTNQRKCPAGNSLSGKENELNMSWFSGSTDGQLLQLWTDDLQALLQTIIKNIRRNVEQLLHAMWRGNHVLRDKGQTNYIYNWIWLTLIVLLLLRKKL